MNKSNSHYTPSMAALNTQRNNRPMEWYEAVRARLDELDLSQDAFAERIGVTQGAVAHWLAGRREPKLEVINRVLAELDLPQLIYHTPAELESGPEIPPKAWRTVAIKGTAQLGPDGYWDALTSADGWLDVPTNDPDAYSLRVKGDSMAPAIRSGWAVWCEPNHTLIPGEYVMVRRTNGECMVKELLYENQTEVSLMAVNDGYGRLTIPREEVEQIHYVGGIVPPSRIRY